jgi:hypothetical protein
MRGKEDFSQQGSHIVYIFFSCTSISTIRDNFFISSSSCLRKNEDKITPLSAADEISLIRELRSNSDSNNIIYYRVMSRIK